jgi:uncharacterized membrane protein
MTPQLQKKVASWVEHGLLTPEQAERIVAHESREPERPWTLYGIAGIGVTALATGFVSLIAANWDDIPPWVKLACYFLLQAGVGYGFLRSAARPGLIRETWLSLFVPLFLAGIGLIAQLHNLHGDGWQALLLWEAITLPAVWLAQSSTLVHLWTVAVMVTSVIWASAYRSGGIPEFGRACIVATVPVAYLAIGFWSEHVRSFNRYLRSAGFVWGMAAVLLIGTPVANALWNESPGEHLAHAGYLTLPWCALIAASLGAWYRPQVKREVKLTMVALLLTSGVCLTLPLFFGSSSDSVGIKIVGAAGFFGTWILAAAAAAYSHHKRWFDLASLVIALRVVVVYFEVFGSLAMTGLGLIFSGIVILGIAFAWHRFRERVRQQLGGGV